MQVYPALAVHKQSCPQTAQVMLSMRCHCTGSVDAMRSHNDKCRGAARPQPLPCEKHTQDRQTMSMQMRCRIVSVINNSCRVRLTHYASRQRQ